MLSGIGAKSLAGVATTGDSLYRDPRIRFIKEVAKGKVAECKSSSEHWTLQYDG